MAQQLFELLKKDHRQAEKLMTQIDSGSEEDREELFVTLQDALEKHMAMEEKHFYPQLKKIKEMKDLVEDALEEHEKAKNFLSQLEEMDVDDDEWISTFQEMREGILHHVQDEEKKVFPRCSDFMNQQQLQEIADKCLQMKEGTIPQASKGGGGKGKK
ncbi:hemerythrin domain-containing protein [Geomesophilobacter sediminis]|uniref:Hemerythrin domain-containing protein n=1 Tax=Geomesophilobacter sediminis TaxID=2798584 RepID=A0A8J7M0N5_9BACT|nr:hemerythrin domain-containing protein [Geomesophilobacter sediminis]MBJ6726117.1 hemerythrin domain-containing protein [Geomesophilobacter sediminis]